jgi:hypothetical protein
MIVAPKVEQYSQRTAIEFYKQCAKHGFSVESIGFKSYATLFYGELEPSFENNQSFKDYLQLHRNEYESQNINVDISYSLIRTNWMRDIQSSKPSCFVAKILDEEVIKSSSPYLKELYRKNGFIFYVRVFDHK